MDAPLAAPTYFDQIRAANRIRDAADRLQRAIARHDGVGADVARVELRDAINELP